MRMTINPKWKEEMEEKLNNGGDMEVVLSFNRASQWLIVRLEELGRKYTVKNCGAGVKKITVEKRT